jgi:hypothetical protein
MMSCLKEAMQIREDEGYVDYVYEDTEGHLTAGIGHKLRGQELLRYKEGQEVDPDTINDWFWEDLLSASLDVSVLLKKHIGPYRS